jgi:signal transduction histidine kinase
LKFSIWEEAKDHEKWRDSVGEVIEELDRLLQLLNTTLDLSEAEAGALHMNRCPVDFSDVVRQLVDIYQPAVAERHHEVTIDLEQHVVVDADLPLLNRVVSNLLENETDPFAGGMPREHSATFVSKVGRTGD